MTGRLTIVFLCVCTLGCGQAPPTPQVSVAPASDARVRALADAFLDGYFERNPDQITLYGVPGRHHDRLPDNSLDALRAWQTQEDTWLSEARQIDPAAIGAAPLEAGSRREATLG